MTRCIQDAVDRKHLRGGLVVPSSVLYQDGERPIPISSIAATFDGLPVVAAPTDRETTYLVSCKHCFDGTKLQRLPYAPAEGEFTAASVLQFRYSAGDGLTLYVTGVVTGICVLHTAAGLRQLFPRARVVVVSDATHPLLGAAFGMPTAADADAAMRAVCAQVGVEYGPWATVRQ